MSTDPVCGMEVHESLAPASTVYEGVAFYFCSPRCLGRFLDNPTAYAEQLPLQTKAA